MNIPKVINSQKLYDLYEQIFDYFSLTVYDLESKIDTNLNISNIKKLFEKLNIFFFLLIFFENAVRMN